jgi:hypothetical protein
MMRFEVAQQSKFVPSPAPAKRVSQTRIVLEELFILLEDYGPAWYTEEHHDRVVGALLERED